jgi:hydroxyethylthiazole kinase-like uncharacterized protein yjeF
MSNVLTADEMRAADTHAIEDLRRPSLTLMENAANSVVRLILKCHPTPVETLVICGKGNNGGDGMATARLLKAGGWNAKLVLIGDVNGLKSDPAENWKRALDSGMPCIVDPDGMKVDSLLKESELIVDALFGTGLTKPLEGVYSMVVQKINHSGKRVIAIDLPSGLNSDSGSLLGPAVRATQTIALAALKYSHVQSPACRMCGEIYVADIEIPTDSTTNIVRSQDISRILPHRPPDSNKGTYGHAVIIGGSPGKYGAPYMSGKSALRCGAGLVTLACPSVVQAVVAAYGPELMTFAADEPSGLISFLKEKNAVAIGPGMGTDAAGALLFREVVASVESALVIDADGLNHLAKDISVLGQRKPLSTILTPHPGEMARLMQLEVSAIQKDRVGVAKKLAGDTSAVVVLKGYRTVVAHPDGAVWFCLTGSQALASAGTGDVLTGIITGFLAQKLKPVEAALAGVYLHGLCSNLFERKYPQQAMNALDILSWWNDAVSLVRSRMDIESEYLKVHFSF